MSCRTVVPILQNVMFMTTLVVFALGLYGYLYRHETNYCEMTYMFENPTYNRISMLPGVQEVYPRYGLYSYCEGTRCESHRRNRFSGSPVLFIVGNADSYRQVRSLGSVAYRMGNDNNKRLDFFSIDFNEELSALFGGVLEQQTQFVVHSIQTILSFYPTNKTIILVGNSIGGLLSRAIFMKSFDANLVRLIITQATPHQGPVIDSDSYIQDFYTRVNQYWRTEWNKSLNHLVLLSLAGGDRDHLVRSDLCSLKGLTDDSRSIDVLTSAVPHVWTSTDHRCIVWCRQLVLTTTKALLQIIQETNSDPQTIMPILKRYFLPTMNVHHHNLTTVYIPNKEPTVITQPMISITRQDSSDYLIPIKNSQFHTIIIHSVNIRIYLKNDRGISDITPSLLPIPPTYSNRKMLQLDIRLLNQHRDNYDAVLIRTENTKCQIDIYQIKDEKQIVDLSSLTTQRLTFNQTGYVKLVFPSLTRLWQVYTVRLLSSNLRVPLMRFHVPWSNEDLYNLVSLRTPSSPSAVLPKALHRPMRLKLHRSPRDVSSYPSLELFLDPQSSYTLEIEPSFLDILSQLIRFYIFLLPTFLFTVLCVSLALQINDTRLRTYQTMLAWQVHLPVAFLLAIVYRLAIVCLPRSSFVTNIYDNGYYFSLLPIILYVVALSIWALIAFIVDYLLFDSFRPMLYPLVVYMHNEFNHRMKYIRWLQWVLLLLPLISTFSFSGSNGHIGLFFLALLHTIWRGTLNQRLREILTMLLLFHGLLVLLNLTGFIIHIRSIFIQGLLPLYVIMPDPSLTSAVCCILAFYCRFLFDRSHGKMMAKLKDFLHRYARLICFALAITSQVYCSYSMYQLWVLICFVFVHVGILFFVPFHQE